MFDHSNPRFATHDEEAAAFSARMSSAPTAVALTQLAVAWFTESRYSQSAHARSVQCLKRAEALAECAYDWYCIERGYEEVEGFAKGLHARERAAARARCLGEASTCLMQVMIARKALACGDDERAEAHRRLAEAAFAAERHTLAQELRSWGCGDAEPSNGELAYAAAQLADYDLEARNGARAEGSVAQAHRLAALANLTSEEREWIDDLGLEQRIAALRARKSTGG